MNDTMDVQSTKLDKMRNERIRGTTKVRVLANYV